MFQGQYGVARTLYFSLDQPAATGPNDFYTGTDVVAADSRVSKDGGAFAQTTNAVVTTLASEGLFSLTLTAGEMTATDVVVVLQDAGSAWRDLHLQVETKQRLGQIDIDASQIGSSASAIRAKASTGGYSFEGVAPSASTLPRIKGYLESMVLRAGILSAGGGTSFTLESSPAPPTQDDFFNGGLILLTAGTGAGQARVITDYVGSTRVGTVNRAWTAPASGTEYVIVPGDDVWNIVISELASWSGAQLTGSTTGEKLQFLFQRLAFKREHDKGVNTQTMYKADGTTVLTNASTSDSGNLQVVGAQDGP